MRISVIVPVWNGARRLPSAVDSLLRTRYPDLEILVVDDGSTDGAWDVAGELARSHPGQVFALRHPDGAHRGVSASRNLGVQRASGDLIAFLDADDYVNPHRFVAAVRILASRPEVEAVYDLTRVVFGSPSDQKRWVDTRDIFGLDRGVEPAALLPTLLADQSWHISAFTARRSLFGKAGLFDTSLRIAEDCNLWFRMACVGTIVAGDMEEPVSVYVRHGANTFRAGVERKVDMVRAMVRALSWARLHNVNAPTLRTLEQGVLDYALRAIMVCRESGRVDCAWRATMQLLRCGRWRPVADTRLARQLAWMVIESFRGRRP